MLIKAGRIWLTTWKTCSRISEKNIKLFLVKYLAQTIEQNRALIQHWLRSESDDALILHYTLTVRSFWKFISKILKFSFEEQRTSNAVSISLWITARLTDKRPKNTIKKMSKSFNKKKYNKF